MKFDLHSLKQLSINRLIFAYVFITCGLVINIIQLSNLILIWPFSKHLYRKINIYLTNSVESNLTSLINWWSQSKFEIFTDSEEDFSMFGKESFYCIMNHTYDVDWLLFGVFMQRLGLLGSEKAVAKADFKYLPILGWSWYFSEYVFLKREWENDRKVLANDIKKIIDMPDGYDYSIAIFCEGTRFTPEKHAESMKVARLKGLPELKHHLLPRHKGFYLIATQLVNKIDYLYDLNLGIRKIDGRNPTIWDVLKGEELHVQLYVRRIPLSSIPSDESECSRFLYNTYQDKDIIMDVFHEKNDFKSLRGVRKYNIEPNRHDLYNSLAWLFIVLLTTLIFIIYAFINFSWTFHLLSLTSLILFNLAMNWFIGKSDSKKSSSKFGLKK